MNEKTRTAVEIAMHGIEDISLECELVSMGMGGGTLGYLLILVKFSDPYYASERSYVVRGEWRLPRPLKNGTKLRFYFKAFRGKMLEGGINNPVRVEVLSDPI